MNPKRPIPKYNSKVLKTGILKAAREKQLFMYKGTPIKLSADFSAETLQSRGHNIFKVLKENKTSTQEYSTQQSYHSELKEI